MHKHVAAAVVVSLAAALLNASCSESRMPALAAEGAGGGAPAIETTDDDSFGSDPDVGGNIGSDPPASSTGTDPGDAHNPYYPVSIGQDPGATPAHFGPKNFPFRVIVHDDGEGDGGGSQRADAKLGFVRIQWGMIPTYVWQCRLRVEMPLRTKLLGTISPSFAATISAKIGSDAANALLPTREWQGLGKAFCHQLKDGLNEMFRQEKGLGATVQVEGQ